MHAVRDRYARHPVSLRFTDPVREAEFVADREERWRLVTKIALGVALVGFVFGGAVDSVIAGSPENLPYIRFWRWAMAVPLAAATLGLLVVLSPERQRRHGAQIRTAYAALQFTALTSILWFVPDRTNVDHDAGFQGVITFVLVMPIFMSASWRAGLCVNVAAVGCITLTIETLYDAASLLDYSNMVNNALMGGALAWLFERDQREAFIGRHRADSLVADLLPDEIARRLKAGERRIADESPAATVLFADLVGFTELAGKTAAPELVAILDGVFTDFDRIAAARGLEKIKTIGDAYMVASGVPEPRDDHASATLDAAIAMRELISAHPSLKIRIGVHSGPVVSGVIGSDKPVFDLWGDTVNIASRMESHGAPGAIQISADTASLVESEFALEARGSVEVKGKGAMETFFVVGRR